MPKPTPAIPQPAPLDDAHDPSVGVARPHGSEAFAGRYAIRSRLGIGGMAEVLLARDTALGRLVALKLLAPALTADPAFVERFRREATAIAALNHANVVVIYDHGVADGQPYIAMEYVEGRTLKEVITDRAPLAPAAARAYASQTLDGLAAAHAVGIVHRDVKPQNLIVRDDGTLKVADFGVARSADETVLTQHGSVIGTADYISPEQARGEVATPASDLYSVGVVLFEMLTGTLPFTGELPLAVAHQHVVAPAPSLLQVNPLVPVALAGVVTRALGKEPSRRYGSAAEMKAALEAASTDPPTPAHAAPTMLLPAIAADTQVLPRVPLAVPVRARGSSRRAVVAALAGAALLVGIGVILATRGGAEPSRRALPRVLGTPLAAARSALQTSGFVVRIAAAAHASQPSGTVAAVRPNEASAVPGATVTIVPSSGPSPIAIPAVTGFSSAAAVAALERLGLVVQPQTAYGPTPSGTAVTTTPPAGTPVTPHSSVALTISAGPAPVAPAAPASPPGKGKGVANGKGHGKDNGSGQKKHKGPGGP